MGQGWGRDGDLEVARQRLLDWLRREIGDERVVQAVAKVPREAFLPAASQHLAYEDGPLSIGYGQTISQPYIVALMTAALDLRNTDKVLEIGTGSGYQAAILAELAARVITMERVPALTYTAEALLDSLGYRGRVTVRLAEEILGYPQEAPFQAILVTAGAPKIPRALLDQLAPEGRLVVPVGSREDQNLIRVTRMGSAFSLRGIGPCRFVPLLGKDGWQTSVEAPEVG